MHFNPSLTAALTAMMLAGASGVANATDESRGSSNDDGTSRSMDAQDQNKASPTGLDRADEAAGDDGSRGRENARTQQGKDRGSDNSNFNRDVEEDAIDYDEEAE